MFLVMPAAVLFATVFSIGALTRHSEITAAKASGISFYRLTLPIFLGAIFAAVLAIALGELVPITNEKRADLLEEKKFQPGSDRYNFVFAAERGRVYKISSLNAEKGKLEGIEIERKGKGLDYPTYVLTADRGRLQRTDAAGRSTKGAIHVIPSDTLADVTFAFDSLHDRGDERGAAGAHGDAEGAAGDGVSRAEPLHCSAGAIGRRRERASRRARAQARDARSRASSSRCSARRLPRARSAAVPRTASASALPRRSSF